MSAPAADLEIERLGQRANPIDPAESSQPAAVRWSWSSSPATALAAGQGVGQPVGPVASAPTPRSPCNRGRERPRILRRRPEYEMGVGSVLFESVQNS